MLLDAATVLVAAVVATLYEFKISPIAEVRSFWRGTLIHGRSMGILLALLCGFIISLVLTSRRLHQPTHIAGMMSAGMRLDDQYAHMQPGTTAGDPALGIARSVMCIIAVGSLA